MATTTIGVEIVIRGLANFTQGIRTMRRQMGLTGANAIKTSTRFSGFASSITNAGQSVRNLGNQMLILGFQITFLTAGPLAAFIKTSSEFESSMVKIITLVGVAEERVQDWSDQLLTLGPALGVGPRELAEAMFFITSAGVRDAVGAMEVLESSAKAAAIGMGETKAVADAVTSSLRAWGEEGLTAAAATDILVATVREGKIVTEELAPSIGRVIPFAQALGVSLAELGAFVATFTRLGVPPAVAITSLRSALAAILKPTAAAREKLEEYELSIDNVRQAIEEDGLAATLIQLGIIFADDNEAMADLIGSVRGLSGVLALAGPLAGDYAIILESIENSAGITEEAFERFGDTTEFHMNVAKAALESMAITIGTILLPGVNKLLLALTPLAQGIALFAKAHPQVTLLAGAFAALITLIGPLLIITGLLISSFGTMITAIGAVAGIVTALLSPFALLLAILGTVAAALTFVFVASLKKTSEKLDEMGGSLSGSAFSWGRNIILQFARGMAAAAGAIIRVLIHIGTLIRTWMGPGSPPKFLPDITLWGTQAMNEWLKGWLEADFNVFNDIARVLEGFIRSLTLPVDAIVPFILNMRDAVKKVIDVFKETGKVSSKIINQIASGFGSISPIVRDYVRAMLDLAVATEAVKQAQEELNEIQERFNELLKPLTDELKEIEDRRREVTDEFRRTELESILADPRSGPLARELALMELREIELRAQTDAIEDERDAELELARARLEAAQEEQKLAQERVNALRLAIEFQRQQNELLKEQARILEDLAKAAAAAADEFEGIGFPKPDKKKGAEDLPFKQFLPGLFGGPVEDFKDPITTFLEEIDKLFAEIMTEFAPLAGPFDEMTTIWSDIFAEAIQKLDTEPASLVFGEIFFKAIRAGILLGIEDIKTTLGPVTGTLLRTILRDLFVDVFTTDSDILNAIEDWEKEHLKPAIIGALERSFSDPFAAVPGITLLRKVIDGLKDKLGTTADEMDEMEGRSKTLMGKPAGRGGTGILGLAQSFLSLSGDLDGPLSTVMKLVDGFLTGNLIPTIGTLLFDAVGETTISFEDWRKELDGAFDRAINSVNDFLVDHFNFSLTDMRDLISGEDGIIAAFTSFAKTIAGFVTEKLNAFKDNVLSGLATVIGDILDGIAGLLEKISEIKQALSGIKLPDILSQTSPSPFEQSILDSISVMNTMSRSSIPELVDALDTIDKQVVVQDIVSAQISGTGTENVNTVNMGGQVINTGLDAIMLQVAMEQALRNVIG